MRRDIARKHQQIMNYALARDADSACAAITAHIQQTAEGLETLISQGYWASLRERAVQT